MKFQKGNKFGKGRPKGRSITSELLDAFRHAAEKDKKTVADWLVAKALKDPKLMLKLVDKIVPDAPKALADEVQELPPIVVNLNATKPTGQ